MIAKSAAGTARIHSLAGHCLGRAISEIKFRKVDWANCSGFCEHNNVD